MHHILKNIQRLPWIIPAIVFTVLVVNASRMHPLWGDESETALFGRSILRGGLPNGWDGTNIMGLTNAVVLNKDLVNHTSPWAQYYLTAASFAIFGESSFTARLPFILISILTIPLIYVLAKKTTRAFIGQDDKGIRFYPILTTIITSLSVQYILYSFQARYYILTVIAGIGMTVALLSLQKIRSWWSFILVASAILFFYANYVSFIAFTISLITITILTGRARPGLGRYRLVPPLANLVRKVFFLSIPIVGGTLPWLLIMNPMESRGIFTLEPWDKLLQTFGILLYEAFAPYNYNVVFPVFAYVGLAALFVMKLRRKQSLSTLVFLAGIPTLYLLIMTIFTTVSYVDTAFIHQRYTTVAIPFFLLLIAYMISHIFSINKIAGLIVMCSYLFTNFFSLQDPRSFFFYLLQEIHAPYKTPDILVADYLKRNAQKGDTAFVNLDRDHEPLIFHLKDHIRFVNRVTLTNERIFPHNRQHLPRFVYDFRDKPDWVILYSLRGDDGSFFTMDYRPPPPELDLKNDYTLFVMKEFFADLSRPEMDHRSFSGVIPHPDDYIYIFHRK